MPVVVFQAASLSDFHGMKRSSVFYGHVCGVSVDFDNETRHLAAFQIAVAFSRVTNPAFRFLLATERVACDGWGRCTVSGVKNCPKGRWKFVAPGEVKRQSVGRGRGL